MPRTAQNSASLALHSACKPPKWLSNCRARSTALTPAQPVRRKIASNSASDSALAPRCNSFSRGRSFSGQSLILIVPPCTKFPKRRAERPAPLPARQSAAIKCYVIDLSVRERMSMRPLQNKGILLGITGGIAAYKSAELVRRLQDLGATVKVAMTPAGTEFVTPLTFQALSGHPVHTTLLDEEAEAGMGHIELARWADLLLVAPASADFLARLRIGQADDLLTAICLATPAMIALAPAMNQGMWAKPSTQQNLEWLRRHGYEIFGPASGVQACGDIGLGRMEEPAELAAMAAALFTSGALQGRRVVITAGPTREAIDPVRYLSNHSSGKMGYALAEAAVEAGAQVVLISGPTHLPPPERVTLVPVVSAQQMYDAALKHAAGCDLFIGDAAVADYRPEQVASEKIKKGVEEHTTLTLVKNPDIIAAVARLAPKPYTVGFAAESERLLEHARTKLERKTLDAVIANDISEEGIGFNSDDNAVTFIDNERSIQLDQRRKSQLARDLVALVAARLR